MKHDSPPCVIVNPNSANGRTGKSWPATASILHGAFPGFTHKLTTRQGEATELARQALREGATTILSLGGDGTHNEVVNGFFDEDGGTVAAEACLGILPSGTGGDFRRSLGMPSEMAAAVSYLLSATPRLIDVGRMVCHDEAGQQRRRFFVNITSFGISGVVDDYVNRTSKALGGKLSFLFGTARALWNFRNQRVRLCVDDDFDEVLTINNIAVANGQYFGGGMWVAPGAALDDGLFDVVIIGDLSRKQSLLSGPKIYKGKHIELPEVSVLRGRRVRATSDELVLIDMDGEQPGRLPIELEIVPAALRVLRGA